MTDFLASHLTDLLARQPELAKSHQPQTQASSFQDQSLSSKPLDKTSANKFPTFSFSTNFGGSQSSPEVESDGDPSSPSSRRSSYFSPQPPVSQPSEENSLIFDALGCSMDHEDHSKEESEGSATSFSSATTTSPQTYCSSPHPVELPPSTFKAFGMKDQFRFQDEIQKNDESMQNKQQNLSSGSRSPQFQKDAGKGPQVRPTFTSMISAPYKACSNQDIVCSRESPVVGNQTASSSSKRLRLVPVGGDARRFKFVGEEESEEGNHGGVSPLSKMENNELYEASRSGSQLQGRNGGSSSSKGFLPNPNTINSTISRAKSGYQGSLVTSEASPVAVRLGAMSPEKRRAFLLSNSNRTYYEESKEVADAASHPNSMSNSSSAASSSNSKELPKVIKSDDFGRNEGIRGRARHRDAPPTSHEELSSQLIGHIKQSPQAQEVGWEHPQMSMSGNDVQKWISGIVPDEYQEEEEDVPEMSQDQIDELQDTFDSLDLNEDGEPAWLERRRATEHAALLNNRSASSSGSLGSNGSSGSSDVPQRLPSPNNLSTFTAPTTAPSSSSAVQQIGEKIGDFDGLHQQESDVSRTRVTSTDMKRQGSSSSINQHSGSSSNSASISDPLDAPKLPTSLRRQAGNSNPPLKSQQKESIVRASEFQSKPDFKPDGTIPSYSISEESNEDSQRPSSVQYEPQSETVDLQSKAQMLDQVS